MKNYKINLPRIFRLDSNQIIELDNIYDAIFYLHVPDIDSVYKHILSKGFTYISSSEGYRLRKGIKGWIMDITIHRDGFIEGYIGVEGKMINTIYDVFDQYRGAYDALHIYYKPLGSHGGWIIDIKRYFRIELPPPDTIPWEVRIIKI